MVHRTLALIALTLALAACGPFVDPNPREPMSAGSLGGIHDTGIGANHMGRIDTQQ